MKGKKLHFSYILKIKLKNLTDTQKHKNCTHSAPDQLTPWLLGLCQGSTPWQGAHAREACLPHCWEEKEGGKKKGAWVSVYLSRVCSQ
jgi:hypothetical protein